MKVILTEDIEKLGKKFDVKNVADGYARNFLLPKNLCKIATEENIKWLEIQKEILAKQSEEELAKIQEKASALDGQEVIITVKIGEDGQLFENINAQKIAEKLKEMGFEIKKTQISLENPIKEIGEFPVKIKLDHNLEVEVRVIITGDIKETN